MAPGFGSGPLNYGSTVVNDSPRYKLERDKRLRDPRRFLHDKLLEAESMSALWERSLRVCYGLWAATVSNRWSIRQAKATKCSPATVSGTRS